ncbi:hypothetical protein FSARC_928 [Fusarium sarcochroum]|uniref:Uncharacterized protein n=1 Tax=Fusarium sarcochroum TaxID=1208366 RepID=A0A8H4XFQ4_9HYPO|nr:hypothetical protein FSARC_928 [Fusarium sarcochroum]
MTPPLPTSESHVYLRPRCGICGIIFELGERFVAMSWERGSEPKTTKTLPQHPIVRLTLDAFGIQRIERLSAYSDRIGEKSSSDSRVFAFIDERFVDRRIGVLEPRVFNTLEDAKISNAVLGRARLQFHDKLHGPWIWNTPSPAIRTISTQSGDPEPAVTVYHTIGRISPVEPALLQAFGSTYERLSEAELKSLHPNDYRLHMYTIMGDKWTAQFRTVSLSHTTGLTFFYRPGKVYSIHSHTVAEPSAVRAFERLPREIRQEVLWVYVPVPPGDRIMAMGQGDRGAIIMDCTFVIRTKLAGDTIIGPIQFHYYNSYSFLDSPPVALVLSEGSVGSVSSFGVMIGNDSNADKFVILPKPRRRIRDRHLDCLQSVAPLEDIIQVQVFLSQKNGSCIGLLLYYENGAQRTLGQCRIGVDPFETHRQPTQICFKSATFADPISEIRKEIAAFDCTREQFHSHIDDDWKCCPLKGNLEVWFNDEEFRVTYIETPPP